MPTAFTKEYEPVEVPCVFTKENAWRKNELAHQKMRERQNWNHPFCAHCEHHRCGDPTIVPGKKALKKSKFHSERKFAFAFLLDV